MDNDKIKKVQNHGYGKPTHIGIQLAEFMDGQLTEVEDAKW